MGKKKIATVEEKVEENKEGTPEAVPATKAAKRRVDSGVLCVESTYNNTKLVLTDNSGQPLSWSSRGSLGFTGAKNGTPFAAAKVGETLAAKAQ
ncbi:MAG: 30S ribosomal protein S11, partial [Patescibacteria group bacterium]